MFARYYVPLTNQFSFMQSGVWNAMSFALPTAIVAKMEYPERDVIGLVGDGAFLMTIGDFVTASEYGADIVMIVLNDGSYGQIDRQQQNLYGAAYGCDFKSPHFADMARSFDAFRRAGGRPRRSRRCHRGGALCGQAGHRGSHDARAAPPENFIRKTGRVHSGPGGLLRADEVLDLPVFTADT